MFRIYVQICHVPLHHSYTKAKSHLDKLVEKVREIRSFRVLMVMLKAIELVVANFMNVETHREEQGPEEGCQDFEDYHAGLSIELRLEGRLNVQAEHQDDDWKTKHETPHWAELHPDLVCVDVAGVSSQTLPTELQTALAANDRLAPAILPYHYATAWTRFSEQNMSQISRQFLNIASDDAPRL